MSSDDNLDENFGKALDFIRPKVDTWIKELLGGVEGLKLPTPQKDLIEGLTVETMLFSTLMPNDEIVAILAGIIQNIATKHAYVNSLDWGKRAEVFHKFSGKQE
jgi:hypothetical protein